MKLFLKSGNQKPRQKLKVFSVISVFQNSEDKAKICKKDLTWKDFYDSLKSMQNDVSPENNGLTK